MRFDPSVGMILISILAGAPLFAQTAARINGQGECAPEPLPANWQADAHKVWTEFNPLDSKKITFESCADYPGGEASLRADFTEGIKTGLRCLYQLGDARQKDSVKLASFFRAAYPRTIRVTCANDNQVLGKDARGNDLLYPEGSNAYNYGCDVGKYPAIAVARRNTNRDHHDLSASLFHETLHWLGYKHFDGVDVTYLSEICCFTRDANLRTHACGLLERNPDWTSASYQSDFSEVMDWNKRPMQGLQASWNATLISKNQSGLFLSALHMMNRKRYPFFGMIFLQAIADTKFSDADIKAKNQALDLAFPVSEPKAAAKRAFTADFGRVMGLALGNTPRAQAELAWKNIQAKANEVCPTLTKSEQASIENAQTISSLALLEIRPKLPESLRQKWTTICDF